MRFHVMALFQVREFPRRDPGLKAGGTKMPSVKFQIAETAEKASTLVARNRGPAFRMIEAARFCFLREQFGQSPCMRASYGWEQRDLHVLLASRTADAPGMGPKLIGNDPGTLAAGDRLHVNWPAC